MNGKKFEIVSQMSPGVVYFFRPDGSDVNQTHNRIGAIMSETTVAPVFATPAPAVAGPADEILNKRKPGRPKSGEETTPKKPGFVMKQLSTCVGDSVKKLAAQLQDKEHNIYAAGVLVFNSLTVDQQFQMLLEAKKLHAAKVASEQAAE